jgi:hypothetical protein
VAVTKNANGIARTVLTGLAILLLIGVVGSFVMGSQARGDALENAVTQARAITDSSLTLVLRPEDTDAPASDLRAEALTQQMRTVVVDPSDFDTVTLWSAEGEILYATEEGRIGNQLDGERERIREALKDKPQTRMQDGVLSVMLPLEFSSGVGQPAAVELTRSDSQIVTAAAPWRTNAIFIAVALIVVVALLLWSLRNPASEPAQAQHPVMVRAEQRSQTRVPSQAPSTAPPGQRTVTVPQPGIKEESDARRIAEDRARAAEERLSVLQEQYRNTLEELQVVHRQAQQVSSRTDPSMEERAMQAETRARQLEEHAREADERARATEDRGRELEERARLFERQAQSLQAENEQLTRSIIDRASETEGEGSGDDTARIRQTEQELIGLRAELEGAQTELALAQRELEVAQANAARARELQDDLDAIHVEILRARETSESAQAELSSKDREVDDLRSELRALRAEEQRAAMLEDELRATKTELESVTASHRADLFEREAELEQKVRSTREEFQTEVARMESQHREQMGLLESQLSERVTGAEDAAQQRLDAAEREIAERAQRFEHAERTVADAETKAERLETELTVARAELETTVAQLMSETERTRELSARVQQVESMATEAAARADKSAADLASAAQENADINRRLQEIEARRQLEIADVEGRADLDDILRVTQERLAGQTEKLIGAEERTQELQKQLTASAERLEEVESELRQQQMAQAMRHIRGEDAPEGEADEAIAVGEAAPLEDRRATSPFMKELSFDARKSLTRIMGITSILKHKKDAKEQAQLVRQLTAHTRRLEHIVSDLGDAETLVHGTIELTVRRTDLETLVRRVVEESGVDADHEVVIHADRLVVAVDPLRTEQIIAGLLRASGDRTPAKKTIVVRLEQHEDGAMITVSDPEPSSDASMSPVVQRFAEAQAGWAKVEGREEGGSSFKVYLPDGAGIGEPAGPTRDVKVVVDTPTDDWEHSDGSSMLVQELHRLSTAEEN